MALGALNSSQFKSGITSASYCKLAVGSSAAGNGLSQDSNYSMNASQNYQSLFLLGGNIETIPKRGCISGRD
jgi:hypothetical protein